MAVSSKKKTKPKEFLVPEVPKKEFWTKERIEQIERGLVPIRDKRGFLKFMKEGMALYEAERRRAEKLAKRGR